MKERREVKTKGKAGSTREWTQTSEETCLFSRVRLSVASLTLCIVLAGLRVWLFPETW